MRRLMRGGKNTEQLPASVRCCAYEKKLFAIPRIKGFPTTTPHHPKHSNSLTLFLCRSVVLPAAVINSRDAVTVYKARHGPGDAMRCAVRTMKLESTRLLQIACVPASCLFSFSRCAAAIRFSTSSHLHLLHGSQSRRCVHPTRAKP
jgi:hypothetical protein